MKEKTKVKDKEEKKLVKDANKVKEETEVKDRKRTKYKDVENKRKEEKIKWRVKEKGEENGKSGRQNLSTGEERRQAGEISIPFGENMSFHF